MALGRIETTYVQDRFIYDADSHIVEGAYFLKDHADPAFREAMPMCWTARNAATNVANAGVEATLGDDAKTWADLRAAHALPAFREGRLRNVLVDKQLGAFGAFNGADHKLALDQLGFQKQVIFNTFSNEVLQKLEQTGDLPLVRAAARAHNRGILEFCAGDGRLMPSAYVPLSDREQAPMIAAEAVKAGAKLLVVCQVPPATHSPTHEDLERVWAIAGEARTPVAMHVGGGGQVLEEAYNVTGRARTPTFSGGEGALHSLWVMTLADPAKKLVAAMIYDGVFMRHPNLKVGVYELGCSWLPAYLRQLDAVARGFSKEPRITQLEMPPSQYAQRQLKVTPYPFEDLAWVTEQAPNNMVMFSSDYPHHEGGRDPLKWYDNWFANSSEETRQRFFAGNFAEFFGGALPVRRTIAAPAPAAG
jgi:predicted TIM-barrel fold metal-dependent hydrolase